MTLSEDTENPHSDANQLTGLEKMGAFFTSQIHDLNNQIASLCNTELLLEMADEPLPESARELLKGTFKAINRLSGTISLFNTVRRTAVMQTPVITHQETLGTVRRALQTAPGWLLQCKRQTQNLILAEPRWLDFIIRELIESSRADTGVLTLSVGPLPPRHYIGATSCGTGDDFLLLHFDGRRSGLESLAATPSNEQTHELALELIRLMGATASLARSDRPDDLLLALRLENS